MQLLNCNVHYNWPLNTGRKALRHKTVPEEHCVFSHSVITHAEEQYLCYQPFYVNSCIRSVPVLSNIILYSSQREIKVVA